MADPLADLLPGHAGYALGGLEGHRPAAFGLRTDPADCALGKHPNPGDGKEKANAGGQDISADLIHEVLPVLLFGHAGRLTRAQGQAG
ncbi:hypothetical protein DQ244_04195 [Blastococcus sp. TBT05-19]|nr:hypothetical protein DQ244_04195 [Blastococcus sp. TBT05-19]